MNRKALNLALCAGALIHLAPATPSSFGASTIHVDDRYAYGANIGWQDWRANGAHGVVFGEYVCSGYIYAADVGWIHLGDGSPADGIGYRNNARTDYGVNHLGDGRLRGMAYGANIGWVTFEEQGDPRVNLITGKLSGYVYGANVGWISLNTAHASVRTDSMAPGADADGDGIPDAWEITHFGGKTNAHSSAIASNQVDTVREAYLAGLDPHDADSALRIIEVAHDGKYTYVRWSSVPSRLYGLEHTDDLSGVTVWTESDAGVIAPDAGPITARELLRDGQTQEYYRVRAIRPLSP